MKKITLFATTFICSVVLSACGGGGADVASVNTNTGAAVNPGTPPKSIEGKMIIDSGRGISNNQDTEKPK